MVGSKPGQAHTVIRGQGPWGPCLSKGRVCEMGHVSPSRYEGGQRRGRKSVCDRERRRVRRGSRSLFDRRYFPSLTSGSHREREREAQRRDERERDYCSVSQEEIENNEGRGGKRRVGDGTACPHMSQRRSLRQRRLSEREGGEV